MRISDWPGNHGWGETTASGRCCATRNMRSRMNSPAPGRAALGNSALNTTSSMAPAATALDSVKCRLHPRLNEAAVHAAIARHAGGPVALGLDELAAVALHAVPALLVFQQRHHLAGEIACIAGMEQHAGLAVPDQL